MSTQRQQKNLRMLIKKKLKEKKWTYRVLAEKLSVQEITVKRWLTNRPMKVDRLLQIAEIVGVRIFDYVEESYVDPAKTTEYSIEQEIFFVQNPIAALVFLKLMVGQTIDQVQKISKLDRRSLLKLLKELERINVLELWPGDRLKFKINGPFRHRRDGPNNRIYFPIWIDIIWQHFRLQFKRATEPQDFKKGKLFRPFEFHITRESAEEMSEDLIKVFSKYRQIGMLEYARKEKVASYCGLLAVDHFESWQNTFLKKSHS